MRRNKRKHKKGEDFEFALTVIENRRKEFVLETPVRKGN